MRRLAVLLASVVLAIAVPAGADSPSSCAPALFRKITLWYSGTGSFELRAAFRAPDGFDPAVAGLDIDVSFEPETDSANGVFVASLPPLVPAGRALVYDDPSGSIARITNVRLTGRGRAKKITVRLGPDLFSRAFRDGTLRMTLTAGAGCVRTCGSPCDSQQVRAAYYFTCKRPTDRAFCGIRTGCELLNASGGHCLLPYPSSAFERDDPATATGKRIAFPRGAMPANTAGVHIDPTAWNTLDGFSPGPIAVVHFPQGVDLAASRVPPLTDFAASLADDSPTILLDATTGARVEHFGELDVTATTKRALLLRPGRRLENGHRYVVALRHLVDASGAPIKPEPTFRALRSGRRIGNAALDARRATFKTIFDALETAGIRKKDLILAWDFHVASDASLESWLLSMRDQTLAQLGTQAPPFTVTQVEDDPFPGDTRICRRVRGTYDVPLFMTADAAGSLLALDASGTPTQTGTTSAPFTALVPCSLVAPTPHAGRAVFYGHGLLGTGFGEIGAEHLRTLADTYGFVLVATDWQGMAAEDAPTITSFIGDLSGFRKLPERLHQGVLNQLVLAHLLQAPDGLSSAPAFAFSGIPVIDPSNVYFYGVSQGGILGGTLMALTPHAVRGVLGVPAANFSTLLQRSVPFSVYAQAVGSAYPDELDRTLGLPLVQQLWDRADPNGWYHHIVANPLPGTPAHKLLVHMSTGDSEVANLATEIMVRSLGIPQLKPVVQTRFGIPEIDGPFDGSAMLESDGGFGPPPSTNTPPAANGAHELMRTVPAVQQQIDRFFRPDGVAQQFCDGACDPG